MITELNQKLEKGLYFSSIPPEEDSIPIKHHTKEIRKTRKPTSCYLGLKIILSFLILFISLNILDQNFSSICKANLTPVIKGICEDFEFFTSGLRSEFYESVKDVDAFFEDIGFDSKSLLKGYLFIKEEYVYYSACYVADYFRMKMIFLSESAKRFQSMAHYLKSYVFDLNSKQPLTFLAAVRNVTIKMIKKYMVMISKFRMSEQFFQTIKLVFNKTLIDFKSFAKINVWKTRTGEIANNFRRASFVVKSLFYDLKSCNFFLNSSNFQNHLETVS